MSTVDPDSVAQDQLVAFVRRIESIEDRIHAENSDKSEVYKEAKGNGFDVKVLRKIIADRRKDATERGEFQSLYDLYWDAIHGVVRAHVENIEEFAGEQHGAARPQPHRAEAVPVDAANAGGENVAAPTSSDAQDFLDNDDGKTRDGGLAPISAVEPGAPHSESAPLAQGVAAVGGGSANPPVASAAVTNITQLHRLNPSTHFATSKGIPRLHGCTNPEACGGTHRALCFSCSVKHDGPAFQGGAA